MNHIELNDQELLQVFRFLLTGRIVRGIVHNFNGPLQILSMHLELAKLDINKGWSTASAIAEQVEPKGYADILRAIFKRQEDRLTQLLEVKERLNTLALAVAHRKEEDAGGPIPVSPSMMVAEEINFMSGDLFFKHHVDKVVKVSPMLMVETSEQPLRDWLDACLATTIESLRNMEGDKGAIEIKAESSPDTLTLSIGHNGLPFPKEWKDLAQKERISVDSQGGNSLIPVAMMSAWGAARLLGAEMEVHEQEVSITVPAKEYDR